MDIEDEHKVCTHFGKLKKKEVARLLEEWAKGGICYKKHSTMATPSDPELRISLTLYELGCKRDTEHKCLVKDFEKDSENCLTLNPLDGAIW